MSDVASVTDSLAAGKEPSDSSVHLGPWHDWLSIAEGESFAGSRTLAWLDRLEAELPEHAAECRDDEARLATVWRHMSTKLAQFLPDEVERVVAARLAAAARRGAAEALVDMVRAERCRLAAQGTGERATGYADADALHRLLDGMLADRLATSRAVTAEVLETLCSIALDLEVTERRAGEDSDDVTESLIELRTHVIDAAGVLRSLPTNVEIRMDAGDPVATLASRIVARYTDTLEARLHWRGGEPSTGESAEALLWVLDELLCHLRAATAGWATVEVVVGSKIAMSVSTPSPAFDVFDTEPLWLLRARLRLQLADGEIFLAATAEGSSVAVHLPR